jgi:nucleotide exchange factor SIL1
LGTIVLILGLLLAIVLFVPAVSATSPPSSPAAKADLICHTSDPKDCYPRVFEPTDEFQIVHDDQEVPPGLHVRLNIYTGKKEAKINVPDEIDPSLEGLPVERSVVIVNPEEPEPEVRQIPRGAPAYEPVGLIKKPQTESESFYDSLKTIKHYGEASDEEFGRAVETLQELSHDLYYGLKLSEDGEAVKALFCLILDTDTTDSIDAPRDQIAASILAGALQNNPSALKAISDSWDTLMKLKCLKNGQALGETFYKKSLSTRGSSWAPTQAKAKISAINGLIKSDSIRDAFLENRGMDLLLEVLAMDGDLWEPAQRRVGQLVLDAFLDEDMGATVGIFPRVKPASDKICGKADSHADERCWDYHIKRIAERNSHDDGHWSKDVHNRLQAPWKNQAAAERPEKEL